MKEIRISPRAQLVMLLAFAALIAAVVIGQLPEARRYYKIETM
jgi:hypothetical protein